MGTGRSIPPEKWTVHKPFDSADYLDGPPPRKMTVEEEKQWKKKKNKGQKKV